MNSVSVEQIEALLPQTQCQKCGYKGCKPYAQAISQQQADINQCPPGGQQGILNLAKLLAVAATPLNTQFGIEKPRQVAVIIEQDCIGCTQCLPPCPVDAIIGASKQMHTVLTSACTGCELCVSPCPVDCIVMQAIENNDKPAEWNKEKADLAKNSYAKKIIRMERLKTEKMQRIKKQKLALKKIKS
ncbi:MAG: RnfABCDGE type electron transport complex subunit B [Methylococcales symbiont of Hymedesmia sp. n. MRB-2018]|nr:MAG: RnfABCDGE type electron transport complex subunit B [Methylococcales symbiont of Hymedesmia sp. n. MRB-2018]KAF3983709.1 MAG: RnfABCDGE type electron transport complex subunit B [Methylococcales symbiont of Hymedesmia sp. n. MRB-2018]